MLSLSGTSHIAKGLHKKLVKHASTSSGSDPGSTGIQLWKTLDIRVNNPVTKQKKTHNPRKYIAIRARWVFAMVNDVISGDRLQTWSGLAPYSWSSPNYKYNSH